ncbi:MAG: AMP nucleosidase, partial [Hyphomonadaceae bacterium]
MSDKSQNPNTIVDQLERIYSDAVDAVTSSLDRYLREGVPPDGEARAGGAFCYPELVVRYDPDGPPPPISRAFGKMSEAGTYVTTITRPDFFRDYLIEQLIPLLRDYDVDVEARRSTSEIPYAYVWDQGQAEGLEEISPAELARWFPSPKLQHIGDEIA